MAMTVLGDPIIKQTEALRVLNDFFGGVPP